MLGTVFRQCARFLLTLAVILSLVSQGTPAFATSPVVAKIQSEVNTLQDLVDNQEWVNVRSYIHGPMGMIRKELAGLARDAASAQRPQVLQANRQVLNNLEKIDAAAEDFDAQRLRSAQNALQESVSALITLAG
ncbi:MAG: hypothetical protein OHK0012_09470 [Synechococcales cyanobacterium]